MSDKIIMLCVALAAVAVIAALFIHRARRYKKKMNQRVGAAMTEAENPAPTFEELEKLVAKDTYLSRYISPIHEPFKDGRSILTRPKYHDLIRAVCQSIGDNDVTITAYLDRMLKAHFDDNLETIDSLYKEKKRDKIS